MGVTLSREIRFGLEERASPGTVNGFAGNPALTGIAPFLKLAVVIRGAVDATTGMLVNIKDVDRLLREMAVPRLREGHFQRSETAEAAVWSLWGLLRGRLGRGELTELRLSPSDFLAFEVCEKEPAMVRVSLRFEFSAAHRLHAAGLSPEENSRVFGHCNNPNGHGHNYEIEVVVSGEPDATGRVMAIETLQEIVNREIIEPFDHKHLNMDCAEFHAGGLNPTVENIARVLYRRLEPYIPAPARLAAVRLWETPKTMCEYTE
jgi:6-pyruvoyltetrahydropterin/6-carboxytetrahydropterin synthase